VLEETLQLDHNGHVSGSHRNPNGDIIAFHKTPGYETYRGLGWYGVIVYSNNTSSF